MSCFAESFVPRPSKRTKPSPEIEEELLNESTEHADEQSTIPAAKVPKYAPTLGMLSPSQETGAINSPPVIEIKDDVEVKEEAISISDREGSGSSDASAYSAHSSGGLKLVFKSSPAHNLTPDYRPDSPQYASAVKSEEVILNGGVNIKQEVDKELNTHAVPFQDYISNGNLAEDVVQGLNSSEGKDLAAEFSRGDGSEDDAAVAGLLSVSVPADSDVHLFDTDFTPSEDEKFSSKHSELFADSCNTDETAVSDQCELDTVHGIMDHETILEIDSDPDPETNRYDTDNTEQDNADDYDKTVSDDDVQLVETENHIQLNTRNENSLPSTADLPETLGGLNTEMESAINSILSLNDTGESNDFADMDDFMNSDGPTTDDSDAMFSSMVNVSTRDTTEDGQDDIEAAVQSILM